MLPKVLLDACGACGAMEAMSGQEKAISPQAASCGLENKNQSALVSSSCVNALERSG